MNLTTQFESWLKCQMLPVFIGEVAIISGYKLLHINDIKSGSLRKTSDLKEWHQLICRNNAGAYRPLKASPDLQTGWEYGPLEIGELIIALQYLYPAAIANWLLHQKSALEITPYQETAARQTGRFAVVKSLELDAQMELCREICEKKCLKVPLWEPAQQISGKKAQQPEGVVPLLCPEACNFFVGKAREKIKGASEAD